MSKSAMVAMNADWARQEEGLPNRYNHLLAPHLLTILHFGSMFLVSHVEMPKAAIRCSLGKKYGACLVLCRALQTCGLSSLGRILLKNEALSIAAVQPCIPTNDQSSTLIH
jgi:hypothetical protein